ncbi:MAG: hypothetical protein ACFFDN_17090 [Candidatus Hodarchaeota archaeon]
MFRLSALFELADQLFDDLRRQKEEYRKTLISKGTKDIQVLDLNQPPDVDSLQAFLDLFFPDRDRSTNATIELLEELKGQGITLADIADGYKKVEDVLESIEKELFSNKESKGWAQIGITRLILELTYNKFWRYRKYVYRVPKYVIEIVEKYRKIITNAGPNTRST